MTSLPSHPQPASQVYQQGMYNLYESEGGQSELSSTSSRHPHSIKWLKTCDLFASPHLLDSYFDHSQYQKNNNSVAYKIVVLLSRRWSTLTLCTQADWRRTSVAETPKMLSVRWAHAGTTKTCLSCLLVRPGSCPG